MNRKVKNIILRLLIFIGFGLFVALSVAAKINREKEGVSGMSVNIDESKGHFFVTKEEVKQLVVQVIGENPKHLTGSDLDMLEERLSELPFIKEVRAFVDNTGTLTVNIQQRDPVIRVIPRLGISFYVDKDGYKFPTREGYTAKVPIVTGFIPESNIVTGQIKSGNLQRVFSIVRYVSRDEFWSAQFAQYNLAGNGDVEVIPRLGDHVIILGDETGMEGKLRRLEIFYHEVLRNIGWETYKVINVQFNNQIICQKNKIITT